jgi:hypothetical protein
LRNEAIFLQWNQGLGYNFLQARAARDAASAGRAQAPMPRHDIDERRVVEGAAGQAGGLHRGHVLRRHQGVDHRLLHGFHRRQVERVEDLAVQVLEGLARRRQLRQLARVGDAEGQEDVAGVVAAGGAVAADADRRALGQVAQVERR